MTADQWHLNAGAARVVDDLLANAADADIRVGSVAGARVIDCGVEVNGSLTAGMALARACLAGRGEVTLSMGRLTGRPLGQVTVAADLPYVPCLLSQYAGWKIARGRFFAMGSGPMRALAGKEKLFEELGYRESDRAAAVGILECGKPPSEEVVLELAESCGVEPDKLTLLIARTASLAGSLQVVARSVETCLHKLHELGFDVRRVRSAIGSALLPPIPRDDLVAIGLTNDSILYGGEVVLWVEGDDDSIDAIGPRLPASASADHGVPFRAIFERYGGDFYKIDPLLFSPAQVVLHNVTTGRMHSFGSVQPEILAASFWGNAS